MTVGLRFFLNNLFPIITSFSIQVKKLPGSGNTGDTMKIINRGEYIAFSSKKIKRKMKFIAKKQIKNIC